MLFCTNLVHPPVLCRHSDLEQGWVPRRSAIIRSIVLGARCDFRGDRLSDDPLTLIRLVGRGKTALPIPHGLLHGGASCYCIVLRALYQSRRGDTNHEARSNRMNTLTALLDLLPATASAPRLKEDLGVSLRHWPEEDWAPLLALLLRALHPGGSPSRALEALRLQALYQGTFAQPVVILAGGTAPETEAQLRAYQPLLQQVFAGFGGTLLSGGTTSGVAGLAGGLAARSRQQGTPATQVLGYLPGCLPDGVASDPRYSQLLRTEGRTFSALEPLQYWIDLVAAGVDPAQVRLLGLNGGRIATLEYQLAVLLGAQVGLVADSGRAAAELLASPAWRQASNLCALTPEPAALRAFVHPGG